MWTSSCITNKKWKSHLILLSYCILCIDSCPLRVPLLDSLRQWQRKMRCCWTIPCIARGQCRVSALPTSISTAPGVVHHTTPPNYRIVLMCTHPLTPPSSAATTTATHLLQFIHRRLLILLALLRRPLHLLRRHAKIDEFFFEWYWVAHDAA